MPWLRFPTSSWQLGSTPTKVQLLGTGLWNDARVLKLPALQGAWFAAPENGGFNQFAERYRAKFGSDPTRIATLAYDATMLAAALARSQGPQRYSESVLTNGSGFNGADGVFRFRPDGQNERGLSILQINNGATTGRLAGAALIRRRARRHVRPRPARQMWIARFSTAMAASFTASDIVGCA